MYENILYDRQTDRQTDRQANTHTYNKTNGQAYKQTE